MLRLTPLPRRGAIVAAVVAALLLIAGVATVAGSGARPEASKSVLAAAPVGERAGPDVGAPADALPTPPATTERMSVGDDESQGNTGSGGVNVLVDGSNADQAISADGRWVAFVSSASNLTPGTTQPAGRLYLRDRQDGTTTAIPWFQRAAWPNGVTAAEPSISADGGAVAFTVIIQGTGVGGIRGGLAGPTPYVVVWDRAIDDLSLVSMDGGGTATPGFQPSISADGRYVAYTQWAPQATPSPTPSDTTPPVMSNLISENDFKCISQGGSIPISVQASDPGGSMQGVILSYTPANGLTTNVSMTLNSATGRWQAVLAASASWTSSNSGFVTYYVRGYDLAGNYSSPFFPPDNQRVYFAWEGCIL